METIKVNMSPNPLDVQTIHVSQNDTEARQWEFELHNNGELIDTSEITEQLFFKAYKGGTEQLLPENTSTPTTSPFKSDIKYPQGLLADQEFTYRQSPTEEDGLAKITDIKGNTLVWNQLVENGNFADTSNWYARDGATLTASNNVGTLTTTSASISAITCHFSYVQNHKYLIKVSAKSSSGQILGVGLTNNNGSMGRPRMDISATSTWQDYYVIGMATEAPSGSPSNNGLVIRNNNATAQTVELKNVQVFDLTQMNLDTLTDAEVKKWFAENFPLPYYDYNQGSLLSFMGNGIKTVGKNLVTGISQGAVGSHGETNNNANRLRVDGYLRVSENESYTFNASSSRELQCYIRFFANNNGDEQTSYIDWNTLPYTFTVPNGANYATVTIRYRTSTAITPNDISNVQFEHGSSATEYEPYTSSTLSLPISTYFPNGMNGFDGYYDVLTENKAVKGIDALDLGTKNYIIGSRNTDNTGYTFYFRDSTMFQSAVPIRCTKFTQNNNVLNWESLKLNECLTSSSGYFVLCADYNDVASLKNALQGVYLYYPLATPTETPITTASLVTENAEIPLSNNDGVLIGKCTEQLSENPGFIDAKIKLSDADGECYSNKIQLHIERSPQ